MARGHNGRRIRRQVITCFFWPAFALLHVTGFERFDLPDQSPLLTMTVNALVGVRTDVAV